MKTPNTIEDEIDAIRLAIYKKIKGMTTPQVTEYYRKSGEAVAKEFGFKIYASVEEARRDTTRPSPRRARPRGRVPRLATP